MVLRELHGDHGISAELSDERAFFHNLTLERDGVDASLFFLGFSQAKAILKRTLQCWFLGYNVLVFKKPGEIKNGMRLG